MEELILEIIKKHFISIVLVITIFITIIWSTAHIAAEPGKSVKLLFGLVEYTKDKTPNSLMKHVEGENDESCNQRWQEQLKGCP